jgi:hypothetical protein
MAIEEPSRNHLTPRSKAISRAATAGLPDATTEAARVRLLAPHPRIDRNPELEVSGDGVGTL